MPELFAPGIEEYAFNHTRPEPAQLAAAADHTRATLSNHGMLTGRVEGRFLKLMVLALRPKLVVEVGTFTGYSALSMAEGLPEGGRIITCELDPEHARLSQANFDASPFGRLVDMRIGPAAQTLRGIDGPVDLAFIDADKPGYPEYYELLVPKMRSGGVILLDNMLMGGRVLDPQSEADRLVHELNARIAADDRVENAFLTVRDGVQMVVKR